MRTRRTLLFLLLATTATISLTALIHIAVTPTAEADEPEETQLLVKCPPRQVAAVRKALAGLEVQIYDLKTMRRVPPYLEPADVPALPDAERLMREIIATVEGVKSKDGVPLLRVTSMTIQERRAGVRVQAEDKTAFDRVSEALAANAHLKGRKAKIEHGALQGLPDGRYQYNLSIKLSTEAAEGRPTGAGATTVPLRLVAEAELETRMKNVYASPIMDDPHLDKGYRTLAREFIYGPATLSQFKSLVANLAKSNVFTVWELRWKVAPAKEQTGDTQDRIGKSVVRIATRAPIAD